MLEEANALCYRPLQSSKLRGITMSRDAQSLVPAESSPKIGCVVYLTKNNTAPRDLKLVWFASKETHRHVILFIPLTLLWSTSPVDVHAELCTGSLRRRQEQGRLP